MSRRLVLPLIALAVCFLLPAPPTLAGKLAEDGRAGVVLAVQGTALLKPGGHARWTPLTPKSILYPGDRLRTSARGAHALEFETAGSNVLVGPASLLEVTEPGRLRLFRGECALEAQAPDVLHVTGPGGFSRDVKAAAWLRVEERSTRVLPQAPRWVESYRASSSDEWMGSLLAQVDGRDVPLAVGYHKVDVEVRDQIARTTVEQSFINSSASRMEGVFHFPLPADASISGFGMWIRGELVEADVVERGRARQIYEDILRRKKDPGLLEWEGGNIFKARVFPIEPHSEKRIRIRYTQVLPLQGDTWRYRYALRSELLRTKPLRELKITVRVVSTQTMTDIGSPTHEVRIQSTGHEATAEFLASEYRPERDFELAVKIGSAPDVTVIPHRRGDDGYFMLLLAPPDEASGSWQRELAPEGEPLDVIVLADTSGSMDGRARANQSTFLAAFLDLLGPLDKVRLAACDVEPVWLLPNPTSAMDDGVEGALEALAARRSLGWTDLDVAMKAVLAAAEPGALVVYLGDGVGTTGDADPVALAERLRAMGAGSKAVVHAVATSSSYETPVLNALSEIGGGSVRVVGAQPARSAFGLLAEAARPVVKDLAVQVEGIRTARVYPRRLPNLPLGSQQAVLGRFLPAAEAQAGTVVVTGSLGGKPVRYSAPIEIPAADVGNAFLPRLWGRKHIDALLAEGASAEVQAEVVAFSERFGIMTPYTSFLVLESDEDREKYGVTRRVRMRDGERFFAQARDKAALEQKRAEMKKAGRWRIAMQQRALREIAKLGRDLPVVVAVPAPEAVVSLEAQTQGMAWGRGGKGGGGRRSFGDPSQDRGGLDMDKSVAREMARNTLGAPRLRSARGGAAAPAEVGEARPDLEETEEESSEAMNAGMRSPATPMPATKRAAPTSPAASPPPSMGRPSPRRARKSKRENVDAEAPAAEATLALDDALEGLPRNGRALAARPDSFFAGTVIADARSTRHGYMQAPRFTLQSLGFPYVPPARKPLSGDPGEPWNDDVQALLKRLPRREAVRSAPGGLHFVIDRHELHPTRGYALAGARTEAWLSAGAWRVRGHDEAFGEPREAWVAAGVRGSLARARLLARTREAKPEDADAWRLPLWDLRTSDALRLWRAQGYVVATILASEAGEAVVELRTQQVGGPRLRLVIDRSKWVIVEQRWFSGDGRLGGGVKRSEFIEVGGRWWAQRSEFFDRKDRVHARTDVRVTALSPQALKRAHAETQALLPRAIVVHGELPDRAEAKQALAEKRGRLIDHIVLTVDFGAQQRWDDAIAAWTAAASSPWTGTASFVAQKPGAPWIRAELLGRARRGEVFKEWLGGLVPIAESATGADRRFLAFRILSGAAQVLGPTERGTLLDRLKGAWIDPEEPGADPRREAWLERRAGVFAQGQRHAEAARVRKEAADAFPYSVRAQLAWEASLSGFGKRMPARLLLERLLEEREPWLEQERTSIYQRLTDRLWMARRLERLQATLTRWLKTVPEQMDPYQRFVSTQYLAGDTAGGDATVLRGLALRLGDDAPEAQWAEQQAAVSVAMGRGWNFWVNQLDRRWLDPLAELCLYLFRLDTTHATPCATIYQDWRFRRTDAYRTLRETLYADVGQDGAVASMPLPRLARYVQWLPWSRNAVDEALWRRVVAALKQRWAKAAGKAEREAVGRYALEILDAHGEREEGIAFAQTRLDRAGDDPEAPARAHDLLHRLLSTPDRDEHANKAREDRVLALFPRSLDPRTDVRVQQAEAARTARRIADRIYRWRYEAGIGSPADRAKLTRAALKTLRLEVRRTVRTELAARLDEAERATVGPAQPWLLIESLGYGVEAGTDVPRVTRRALQILRADWKREAEPLERLMRERAAVVLAYAATRKDTAPDLAEKVLRVFLRGDATYEVLHAADPDVVELLDWRYQAFRLLVARDDVPGLTALLDAWIVPAKVESRWRIARGYLHAETGALAPAAEQFEAVRALDELAASDYAVLASWYLVLGRDDAREATLEDRYEHMNENEISNLLWQHENRMGRRRGGVPQDVDPEAFRALRYLMRKAGHPGNYWYRIRNLYRAGKDFRALAALGDGLVGHTKEGTYGILRRLDDLVGQVHEEATCDELSARLETLVRDVERPLDRRALRLGIARVAARAAKVKEADPAHAGRALGSLRAAFQEDWQPGERRLMARYLQQLGTLSDDALKAEQFRQLEQLLEAEAEGSADHLAIGLSLAQTLWGYKQQERALAVLKNALGASRRANGGRLPDFGQGAFDTQVNWLAKLGRFVSAERVLLAESERVLWPQRRKALRGRLYQLYVDALQHGGSVSIGRGAALFETAAGLMEQSIETHPVVAGSVLQTFCALHRAAAKQRTPTDAPARLRVYAAERLPAFLRRVPLNAAGYTTTVASALHALQGPKAGLGLLLDRADAEPEFLARIQYDVWHQSTWNFVRWRYEADKAGGLGALAPRLLARVIAQIEQNLLRGGSHGRAFWNRGNKWAWNAKTETFADTAKRVAELHEQEPAVLDRAAKFLWSSLGRRRAAIAILQAAQVRGQLSEAQRWTLTSWLTQQKRYAEALPLCVALAESWPDNARYRTQWAKILGSLDRKDEALEVLRAAEVHFREKKLWRESRAASFGEIAAGFSAAADAERWMDDAIRLRQERRGHRGGRDSRLAGYYRTLAKARGLLGKTRAAVNAAATAILSSNTRNQSEMRKASASMDSALRSAKSLPAFVASYEAEVAESGLDAPLVRKALARVFTARKDYAAAAHHLLAARELSPGDAAVHKALVQTYDLLGDSPRAVEALFGSIRLAPHNLAAYADLAARYRKAGDEAAAERALTTLVEPSPNQADGHRRLATIRQEQDRWTDAIVQWRQVVRTERLDPTGWLSLARAQGHTGDKAGARRTLEHVLKTPWEKRFGDPKAAAAELLSKLGR